MRIPFNKFHIRIIRPPVNTVRTKPLDDEAQWKYSDISILFTIDLADFEKLCLEWPKLEKIDPAKAHEEFLDGYGCSAEYGSKGKKLLYSCPDEAVQNRGLTGYLNICRRILVLSQLDPDEILRKKATLRKGIARN